MEAADLAVLALLAVLSLAGIREALGPPPVRWTRSWIRLGWYVLTRRK